MLAISNLGAACIGVGGFLLGVFACYLLVAWAYSETENTQSNKVTWDENSYS